MRGKSSIPFSGILVILIVMLFGSTVHAQQPEAVLYSFDRNSGEGYDPQTGGLVSDAAGNLYGTTYFGGAYNQGTVFELIPAPDGDSTEITLHSFGLGTDGFGPVAGLIFDSAGNLYGTTYLGGEGGGGTVFELTPNGDGTWTETTLYSFYQDGVRPLGRLTFDAAGNLYGTTYAGGAQSYGTVFALTPNGSGGWTYAVLHSFGLDDGAGPEAGLTFDAAGNLYGTTTYGGNGNAGTVFELTPEAGGGWSYEVLYRFSADGFYPVTDLIFDRAGNMYGTTLLGGSGDCGTVFGLRPKAGGDWTEGVVHNFSGGSDDGCIPEGDVTFDDAGHLYGTTGAGGAYGYGTVFGMKPKVGGGGPEVLLHSFKKNFKDGVEPEAGLIFDRGWLVGTTIHGGRHGFGTVFALKP